MMMTIIDFLVAGTYEPSSSLLFAHIVDLCVLSLLLGTCLLGNINSTKAFETAACLDHRKNPLTQRTFNYACKT